MHHKQALRYGRGLAALGSLSLDLKLGLRMLSKYPPSATRTPISRVRRATVNERTA